MRWRIRGGGKDAEDSKDARENGVGSGGGNSGRNARNAKSAKSTKRDDSRKRDPATTGPDPAGQRRDIALSWQRLGRLQPTAAPLAPILAPMGLPELASTRSLIHKPHRVRPTHAAAPIGTVLGIASVLPTDDEPAVPEPLAPPVHQDPVIDEPVRRVVAPITVTPPVPEPTLTYATEAYVGEPREPAVPHRAPGWLRAAMPSGDSGIMTPLDAFASPMSFPAQSWTSPMLTVPPPAPGPSASDTPAPPVQRRSRRPGLGAPLQPAEIRALKQRAAQPEPEPETETTAEVATAAPAEAVPEPAPRPRQVVQPLASTPSAPSTSSAQGAPAASTSSGAQQPGPAHAVPVASSAPQPEPTHSLPARFTSSIPANLAAAFERAHGHAVGDVRVDRGPTASAEAGRIGARAFTRGDLIVLPPEAGPEDAGAGLALLGHELTHVIQQRVLGGAPPENSEFGRELEAAAQATEAWIRAGAAGPPPPVLPEPPAPMWDQPAPAYRAAAPAGTTRSSAAPSMSGAASGAVSGALSAAVSGRVQRAPEGAVDAPPRPAGTIVIPAITPATSTQTPPTLVHPAASTPNTTQTPETSASPRTEDELNRMIASGALDSYLAQNQQQPPAPAYDREQRRTELTVTLLDQANAQRAERGDPPLTELPPELAAMIETHLDEEQVAALPAEGTALGPPGTTGPGSTPNVAGSGFPGRSPTGPGSPPAGRPGPNAATGAVFELWPGALGETGGAPGTPGSGPPAQAPEPPSASASDAGPTPGAEPAQQHEPGAQALEASDLPDLNEEQVARLYERIKTRLRRELLVDRERSGHLMDFR